MIVIPMAGLSSRFYKAGYTKPKYMLEAKGKTLFEHSVESFSKYFKSELFVFIVRDTDNSVSFIRDKIELMGLLRFKIVVLDRETRGQAETVALGLKDFSDLDESLIIFNIDTFRPNFTLANFDEKIDGYLEVFEGEGEHWSFVKPISSTSTKIKEATEKRRISPFCSTGLYYFSKIDNYIQAYSNYLKKPKASWEKGELYIAPLYNFLISENLEIHYHLIAESEVIFCGTPDEYVSFNNSTT